MKKQNLTLSISLTFVMVVGLFVASTYGQSNCEVRMPSLKGQYHGNCKDGVAHGYGVAIGEDTYKGNFKNGLPHGQGTYIWANGNKYEGKWKEGKRHGKGKMIYKKSGQDSTVTGMWKNGQFARAEKEEEEKDHEVNTKDGVDRVKIYRNGDRNMVEIVLQRHGSSKDIRNLRLNASSGTKNTRSQPFKVEFPKFPFQATILFEAPSKLQTYYKKCEVGFEINKPGRWVVEITY